MRLPAHLHTLCTSIYHCTKYQPTLDVAVSHRHRCVYDIRGRSNKTTVRVVDFMVLYCIAMVNLIIVVWRNIKPQSSLLPIMSNLMNTKEFKIFLDLVAKVTMSVHRRCK
jgi:hypothetical protein